MRISDWSSDVCSSDLADRKSFLMTDESAVYPTVGEEFAGHGTVNHSAEEYVRGTFYYTNTVESYFAILKRGIMGSFHNVSEAHLRSEEHTSELQSLMRISYAVFCLQKKNKQIKKK